MTRMSLSQRTQMRATPALLTVARLLELPGMRLHEVIQAELAANPALEQLEAGALCAACSGPLVSGVCQRCFGGSWTPSQGPSGAEHETDLISLIAQPWSLSDALLVDLRTSLTENDHEIAAAIVGSLDGRGLLTASCVDIAAAMDLPEERAVAVLALLQELGPPGIGARSVRESLLAQIDALQPGNLPCQHARAIVSNYLDDLAAGRFDAIARALGVPVAEVECTQIFVQARLHPGPAGAVFSDADGRLTQYLVPEIAIDLVAGELRVEILHSHTRWLRLDPLYRQLAARPETLSTEERAHVLEYASRARVFLRNLQQRETTLHRVSETVAARQRVFLCDDILPLVTITQREIAHELNAHESTISRAVNDKVVQLPNQRLWNFADLLGGPRAALPVLRELVRHETEPMTDDELATELARRGYPIARRTVAKYRERLGVVSYTHRRTSSPS